ncbi:YciI family protein [Yoonia vestfoldensis]|uniref:YciI family protein n=1 Tax=Yoonia vestfoldensis TaxID=245188 RepID=UPI000372D1AB|nr:YciI family protein [Yoonia vestfoldensis]
MQYMILNYTLASENADAAAIAAAADGAVWERYTRALIDAGVFVSGNALHPSHTATTLRLRAGERDIQDGPYAASKEQFGGYYIIDVADLDTALHWAALNPAAAAGAVEVRPVVMRATA